MRDDDRRPGDNFDERTESGAVAKQLIFPEVTCEACDAGYRLNSDGLHYDDDRGGRTWGVCRKVVELLDKKSTRPPE